MHMSDCVQITCELPLLPNNTASETFFHKSGAVRSVDWIFMTGAATGRKLDIGQNVLQYVYQTGVAAAPVTATFSSLSHSSTGPLLETEYNYTLN